MIGFFHSRSDYLRDYRSRSILLGFSPIPLQKPAAISPLPLAEPGYLLTRTQLSRLLLRLTLALRIGFNVRELNEDAPSFTDALLTSIENDFPSIAANPEQDSSCLCWEEICATPKLSTFGDVQYVHAVMLFVLFVCAWRLTFVVGLQRDIRIAARRSARY